MEDELELARVAKFERRFVQLTTEIIKVTNKSHLREASEYVAEAHMRCIREIIEEYCQDPDLLPLVREAIANADPLIDSAFLDELIAETPEQRRVRKNNEEVINESIARMREIEGDNR
jgi:hypothetical protein